MRRKIMRSLGLLLTCGIALVGLAGCKGNKYKNTPKKEGYKILWADEFDGEELNKDLWMREERPAGWTNEELQAYTDKEENGFVRDGKFVIKGIEKENGYYSSCKLRNTEKASFMYGRIEASAKVPTGKGLWPAIWMMPLNEDVYGQWPKCGEIDIMEVLGDNVEKAYGTLHWGSPHAEKQGTVTKTGANSFANEFHTYAVEWEPGQIEWFIDGESYLVVNDWFTAVEGEDEKPYPAPFNQKFCIQINLAIGGTWPGNPEPGAEYMDKAEFEIDYVRVYQKKKYDTNVTKPEKTFRDPDATGNYISDSRFEGTIYTTDTGSEVGWIAHLENDGGNATFEKVEGGGLKVTITGAGIRNYSVQIYHTFMPFQAGKKYKITFDMWGEYIGEDPSSFNPDLFVVNEICVDAPNANWSRYWRDTYTVPSERTTFTATFDYTKKDDAGARFEFNMGCSLENVIIYIDNVRVEEVK